ncbi:MAG: Dipeptidyl carboxypeptidase, partial [Bacteroidota bacterium]
MKKIIFTFIMGATIITSNAQTNPLLFPWKGKYGGVPAFNEYKVSDIKPAVLEAVKENLVEINTIATNPKPATFSNTIEALERAGSKLARVNAIFGIYSSNMSSPEFELIEADMVPLLSDLSNKFYQNTKLFKRIAAVYSSP